MEALQGPFAFGEPVEEDVEPNTEERESSKSGASSEAAVAAQELMAPIDVLDSEENSVLDPQTMIPPLEYNTEEDPSPGNPEEDVKPTSDEPFMEWFEPIEDDEDEDDDGEEGDDDDDDDAATSLDKNEQDDESLGEESGSMTGSEKTTKKIFMSKMPPRKRTRADEGWVDWPDLGEGWKRKEVIRQSGNSIGQKDVYYMGPQGSRVRSRVELLCHFSDLDFFDYKSGKFLKNQAALERPKARRKRGKQTCSSSGSSVVDRGEGIDNPDSPNGSQVPKNLPSNQTGTFPLTTIPTPNQGYRNADVPSEDKIKLPLPSSSNRPLPLPSINGEIGTEDSTLVCAKCGFSFTGTWYDKQRKRPCCPTCWASKTKEHPMIRFRKWIPCGQCVGCHNTVNCGQCANCKHGLQSPESRKRICRKRKCICPIRKTPGNGSSRQANDLYDDCVSFEHQSHKSSDTENLTGNLDDDDDEEEEDMSTDDDDDWHKKRKRRACGECTACLCRKDCGTCDFCIDKPKFGGSNKKRQKCRLRQCQRQAMRHLLPFQVGEGEYGPDGTTLGRPRPHYTYSRKATYKRAREQDVDTTDNDDDESHFSQHTRPLESSDQSPEQVPQTSCQSHSKIDLPPLRWDAEKPSTDTDSQNYGDEDDQADNTAMPIITQIMSLADVNDNNDETSPALEHALFDLLHCLRSATLPQLWSPIMAEGPVLQIIQCSPQSKMTDTTVMIYPGFSFEVAVQKQPLHPSHWLYEKCPRRLSLVSDVISLLLSLEKYVVCQGLMPREPGPSNQPLILDRAPTCDFLVRKNLCNQCMVALRVRLHTEKIRAASAL